MNTHPKVAVVILNFSTQKCLEDFLPSVVKTDYPNLEIVVADNASQDNSVNFIKSAYPDLRLIQFHKNFGYAEGYNKALALIKADYFVLLNSDVEVEKNWLYPLVQMAESDNSIAAIQPLILDYKNKNKYEYAGAAGGFMDSYGYPFCRGRVFKTLEDVNPNYHDSIDVFWASGACLFVRASSFWQVGGLDSHFFAHMEEIDLCWRLKIQGFRIKCAADAKVYHLGGATLAIGSPKKTYLNFRNGLIMLAKNLPSRQLFGIILMRLIIDHIAAYSFLLSGKPRHFFAVAKAHFHFITNVRKYTKYNKHQYNYHELGGIKNGSIVWDYFVKGKKRYSDVTFK
jgi:GT2 family glycosyltransferase